MKIGLQQFNPTVGAVTDNKEKILEAMKSAHAAGVELLIFPELALVGYPPRDLLDLDFIIDANLSALKEIQAATTSISVVVGFVDRNPGGVSRPYFNCAAVLSGGKEVARYAKRLLPSYDIFDEVRYFEPGDKSGIFTLKGKKFGLSICEDIWNFPGYLSRLYPGAQLTVYAKEQLDAFINISASPFHLGKPDIRVKLLKEVAGAVQAPVVMCNQVGGNDEVLFDGGSLVVDGRGKLIVRAEVFHTVRADWVLGEVGSVAPWPESETEWLNEALQLGIRDYCRKVGIEKVCLGLSGGIDSSVTAALAVQALGKSNVLGVALPTRFTADQSVEDAQEIAQRLGIECLVLPIEDLFKLYESHLQSWRGKKLKGLTHENIQPRIRMTLLMAIANEENRLLLNTSNKSELATGYSTLYGDAAGSLAVLGDLTKRQIYSLARLVNQSKELIPERVIQRVPTAELRENQTDQDTLPPYAILDELVSQSVEGSA